ncbi:MAG: phosphoribosyltransferase family protein [Gemmatimonadota bacterium]
MLETGFEDRRDAGRQLAERLARHGELTDPVVLALPRGGVPVGYEVARALDAPLAPFLVRKLGVPNYEELAMGAIAAGGIRVLDDDLIERIGVPSEAVDRVVLRETQELERRQAEYDGKYAPPTMRGRTAILVDDGIATGASIRAAIEALRVDQPAAIVVAVPVAATDTAEALRRTVEAVVCVVETPYLDAVGAWYRDFRQTTDAEVLALLAEARESSSQKSGAP